MTSGRSSRDDAADTHPSLAQQSSLLSVVGRLRLGAAFALVLPLLAAVVAVGQATASAQ